MIGMAAWLVASGRFKQVRVFFLMVGHTHIIIDQIFGVITVNLRHKDILLPEDLSALIDQAMEKNPQYQAQPVEWLHSLWDFWAFIKSMGVTSSTVEGAFKRPEITDDEGGYIGMNDLIFKKNDQHLVTMQYREKHHFPLRPENGMGVPILRNLPPSPPSLATVQPFEAWGKRGCVTFQQTVSTVLQYSTVVRTPLHQQQIRQRWDFHLSEIPTVIELLKQEYKLKFEDWNYDPTNIPRIAFQPGSDSAQGGGNEGDPVEVEYRIWRQEVFASMRDTPFAYDPVVSGSQSAATYKAMRQLYEEALLCGTGPTISVQSLVIGGAYLFAAPRGSISLYKVENIGKGKTPRSVDPVLTCSLYTHKVNPSVSGFFGSFQLASAGTGKTILTRGDVVVYNVALVLYQKVWIASLDSLRALAVAKPDDYPMPDDIPDSHLSNKPQPARRRNRAEAQESSDDQEFDEWARKEGFGFGTDDLGKRKGKEKGKGKSKRRTKAKKGSQPEPQPEGSLGEERAPERPKRNGTAGSSGPSYAGQDEGGSDSDEDASSSEAEQDSSDAEDTAQQPAQASDPVPEAPVPASNAGNGTTGNGLLELPPPADYCPPEGQLTFVQLEDDTREFPISLALAELKRGDEMQLRWFADVNLTTLVLEKGKNVTFSKYWDLKDKKSIQDMEIDMGIRNKNKTKKKGPAVVSKEKVEHYWSKQTYSVRSSVFVPVHVPLSSTLDKLWECDAKVVLPGPFLRDTLLPALKRLTDVQQ